MKRKLYIVTENKYDNQKIKIDINKMEGFKFSPKNSSEYLGIEVNSMLVVKPSFIDKLLKKKTKRKLDYYLKYLISILDSDDTSDDSFRQALDDIARYKEIIEYKYRKYLDDKYINLLLKKINLIERELKERVAVNEYQNIVKYMEYDKNMEYEEEKKGKSR